MTDTEADRLKALFAGDEDPPADEGFVRTVSERVLQSARARILGACAGLALGGAAMAASMFWLGPVLVTAADPLIAASTPYLAIGIAGVGLSLLGPIVIRLIR